MTDYNEGSAQLRPPGYRPVWLMFLVAALLFPAYLFLTGRPRRGWQFIGGLAAAWIAFVIGGTMNASGQTAAGFIFLIPGALTAIGLGWWAIIEGLFFSIRKTREYNKRLLDGNEEHR